MLFLNFSHTVEVLGQLHSARFRPRQASRRYINPSNGRASALAVACATWDLDLAYDVDRLALAGLASSPAWSSSMGRSWMRRERGGGIARQLRTRRRRGHRRRTGALQAGETSATQKGPTSTFATAYHRQRSIHYQLTLQQRDKHCDCGG
jgi:hypothetical protein